MKAKDWIKRSEVCSSVSSQPHLYALASPSVCHRRKSWWVGDHWQRCVRANAVTVVTWLVYILVRENDGDTICISLFYALSGCKLFYVLCTRAIFLLFFRLVGPGIRAPCTTYFFATQWLCSVRHLHLRCHNLFLPYSIRGRRLLPCASTTCSPLCIAAIIESR